MFVADLFEVTLPQPPKKSQPDHMYVEAARPQLVAILPGRFQPWHLGHLDVFRSLQRKFGRDNAFVATSNVTSLPKSPFNFTDKTVFMTATGVPIDRIIEVTDPYKLPSQFDPAKTIFVVAVGAPDKQRLSVDGTRKDGSPTYFKTFESLDKCTTADKHGYVIIADEREKLITLRGTKVDVSHGTQTRETWNQIRNDPQARAEFLTQMYGRNDPEVARVLDKIPQSTAVSDVVGEHSSMPVANDSTSPIHGLEERTEINEWVDPGAPCAICGKSLGDHLMRAVSNKPDNVTYIDPEDEWDDLEFVNAEDHEYRPSKGWKPLTQDEAELVGFRILSGHMPDDIYSRIQNVRDRIKRVGKGAGKLYSVKEEAAGVGVVSNSKDPRYVMATMGDQNDVNAGTLNKQMRAMGLLRKIRALKEQMQVLKRK